MRFIPILQSLVTQFRRVMEGREVIMEPCPKLDGRLERFSVFSCRPVFPFHFYRCSD